MDNENRLIKIKLIIPALQRKFCIPQMRSLSVPFERLT